MTVGPWLSAPPVPTGALGCEGSRGAGSGSHQIVERLSQLPLQAGKAALIQHLDRLSEVRGAQSKWLSCDP